MNERGLRVRTRGQAHGFIRRMVSPGDLGEHLKPFVFLDHVDGVVEPGTGFGWHPHSGIATLTYSLDADAAYEDTTGQKGLIEATGLEWMRAGGGTWHQGFIHPRATTVTAFQVWLALPPGVEDGPSQGLYVSPRDVPQVENVRVLLGEHLGRANPIPPPSPLVLLDVVLASGRPWTFTPPPGHGVAWAFVYRGRARVSGSDVARELVVFDEGEGPVTFEALEETRLLFGCAKKHEHPLVLGSHSVHTNETSLARGVAHIRDVGATLRRAGRL
ncbi:MAG: pirin family protein [Myxococcaceae bacterium]|jgi:redox-sensitive bicupin YhaK (pirin superfamily)|nr:pirin family protein [Myxococcaceae bacterium]